MRVLSRIFLTETGQRLQALNIVIGNLVRISIKLLGLFGLKKMNDTFQAALGRANTHQQPVVSACEYVCIKRVVVMQQFIEKINTAGFWRFSLHIQVQLFIEVRRTGVTQVHLVVTVYLRVGAQDMADQAAVRTHMAQQEYALIL